MQANCIKIFPYVQASEKALMACNGGIHIATVDYKLRRNKMQQFTIIICLP